MPKPQSLLALEDKRKFQPQPVPIKWNNERTLPTQRLPPFHKEILKAAAQSATAKTQRSQYSYENSHDLNQFLRRFSQSPFDSRVHRFKSPPVMLPLENEKRGKSRPPPEETFTILEPQPIQGIRIVT